MLRSLVGSEMCIRDRDKKVMLHEVHQERKLLEKQHNEFIESKMQTLSEIQSERMLIMKERTEAAMTREKFNKDEAGLLVALRQKEEEYQCRLDAIAADRDVAQELRREAQQLRDDACSERDHVRGERATLEAAREEVLLRVEDVRRRAEDAVGDQQRLRKELAAERASSVTNQLRGGSQQYGSGGGMNQFSQLQSELAKQRAALSRLNENL
eukprot:TRINITY_DN15734_c0_g1_i1.p1 TRINITY_DN15734_c0_g1~~TRINITY_DN15734_c0_g1_i1.p1  ORF type:complete len:248 (+),score=81.56 TRINITY_DN15734_c0_g1_i1:109-744(+)